MGLGAKNLVVKIMIFWLDCKVQILSIKVGIEMCQYNVHPFLLWVQNKDTHKIHRISCAAIIHLLPEDLNTEKAVQLLCQLSFSI